MWPADGRHILFCRICRGAGETSNIQSVWLMDASGGGAVEVAGPLHSDGAFEGESWFGYYGTIDWRAVMDYHRGGK